MRRIFRGDFGSVLALFVVLEAVLELFLWAVIIVFFSGFFLVFCFSVS